MILMGKLEKFYNLNLSAANEDLYEIDDQIEAIQQEVQDNIDFIINY